MYAKRSRWINLSTTDFFFSFIIPQHLIDSKIWKFFHFLFLLRYNRAQFINNIFIDKIKHRKNMCICAYIYVYLINRFWQLVFSLSLSLSRESLICSYISPFLLLLFFLSFSSSYHRHHILQRKGKRMRESERDIGNQ